MNAETFFESFDLLAEAPNSVVKLRELVLEFAIRGMLLPQDPTDESAEDLLERIGKKRGELAKLKLLKSADSTHSVDLTEVPFSIPSNWTWVRLDFLMQKMGAGSTPLGGREVYVDSGVKFLRSQNVWNDGLVLDDVALIKPETHEEMSGTHVKPGDVLLNITGASIGRSALVPDDFDEANVSQHVAILRAVDNRIRHFLHLVVISPCYQNLIMKVQVGVSREGLSMTKLREFPFPLPPLAEQRRIVSKVDDLLGLCDELETRQGARRELRERLVQVALDQLLASRDPADFATHWQRLQTHFDILFDAADIIPQLRRTLLQLAIQGRLVYQDVDDEPADKLLSRIQAEKSRLEELGEVKTQPPTAPIADREVLFSIPSSWKWVRAAELSYPISSGSTPVKSVFQSSSDGGVPYLKVYNIRGQNIDFDYCPQYINETHHSVKMKRSILIPGMVVLNIVGPPLGKTAIIPPSFPEWNCNQAIAFFRMIGDVLPEYIHLYFKAGVFLKNIDLIGTAGQDNISVTKCKNIVIPLPPFAEQKRIVSRVTELLSVCDLLEAKLTQAEFAGTQLLSAAVQQLLLAEQPMKVSGNTHDFKRDTDELGLTANELTNKRQLRSAAKTRPARSARSAPFSKDVFLCRGSVASYAVRRLHKSGSFGETQLVKTLYVAQSHLGVELEFRFARHHFGPLATDFYRLQDKAKEKDWFSTKPRAKGGVTYHPGTNLEQMCRYAPAYLKSKQAEFDKLLDHISQMNTDQAELFATAYAAWNDLLIDGIPADEEAIIAEIHGWHEDKKRFKPPEIRTWLQWMRAQGYVPVGHGERTTVVK